MSFMGLPVVILGIVFALFYFPAQQKQKVQDVAQIQRNHLEQQAGLKIYRTAENIEGVMIEDEWGRNRYLPWNRAGSCCILPNEAEPVYAIRVETLTAHEPYLELLPTLHISMCRETVYNRKTGEVLARLFEYPEHYCRYIELFTDEEKKVFQAVLKPAVLTPPAVAKTYHLSVGSGKDKEVADCDRKGRVTVAEGFSQADILLEKRDSSLVISLKDTGDSVICKNYFLDLGSPGIPQYPVPIIRFADGKQLYNVEVNPLVGMPAPPPPLTPEQEKKLIESIRRIQQEEN
ncbi:MAG: calcium-binding protein [Gallionella sp.]|nr:calcium-binding protein [Gallionella sp.]MDD4958359.1 calcium-binding protein [Gallionella sp.]